MALNKSRAKDVMAALRSRDKTVKEVVPFVGDIYGLYRLGCAVAIVEAPHLSFSMNVTYADNNFFQRFTAATIEEENRRKQEQANKF